jgi:S-DNA-T family DNA segregation ATPase FtsK/SpoIIIE
VATAARAGRPDLPPLPVLLLVCDEFTEPSTAKPDFIDLFLHIGRVGRSLGLHLLLATQRLEKRRLRGLESNLSYKIALRTFTAAESRIALGATDAADLPSSPGHGYLKDGTQALQRFKAAYVSGPYTPPQRVSATGGRRIQPFPSAYVPPTRDAGVHCGGPRGQAPSVMDVIVGRVQRQGPPAHRVWLPPLADPPVIDTLLGGLVHDGDRGSRSQTSTCAGRCGCQWLYRTSRSSSGATPPGSTCPARPDAWRSSATHREARRPRPARSSPAWR